jgi:hypothetical protein
MQLIYSTVDDPFEKTKFDELSGEVTFMTKWLPFVSLGGELDQFSPIFEGQQTLGMLHVFVYNCHNIVSLDDGSEPTSR